MLVETKFLIPNKSGRVKKHKVVLDYEADRIVFVKSPFGLKDEIKAMQGARWHGFEDPPRKVWSVKNSPRNRFQIDFLEGKNPYAWFDREVKELEFTRPLYGHQKHMVNQAMTYHFQVWGVEMSLGKSLAAIEVIERSKVNYWWWVGPKNTLPSITEQFNIWELDPTIKVIPMTYDKMVQLWNNKSEGIPQGVIFDEASLVKTPQCARAQAAQGLTDEMRHLYGHEAFVILMSGTPSPKRPSDIWSLCEIAYPGFLREGSLKALEQRLGVFTKAEVGEGYYNNHVGWLDGDNLCKVCCLPGDQHSEVDDDHAFQAGINEVALLYERLQGLMVVLFKKDCIDLPPKVYHKVRLQPSKKLLRVARTVADVAMNTMTGMTQLRQLSDGFMYTDVANGMKECPVCAGKCELDQWVDPDDPERILDSIDFYKTEDVAGLTKQLRSCPKCKGTGEVPNMKKTAYEIPCPKADALVEWLGKCEEKGRMLCFAGYQGSVDRCMGIAHENGWTVWKLDGRASHIIEPDGTRIKGSPLEYWRDTTNEKVVFVANPESGGMGLTLIEADTAVFYSNSFKGQYRTQGEDRIHRPGQVSDCHIVDFFHLPTDERAYDIITNDRRLEKMLLGEVVGDSLEDNSANA